ncbi:MAG: response regulator, partial [Oceanidesulfovibrio sp.]
MPLYQDASPRKYVLVVDSERVTRLTFESILTRAGYRVVTAANLRDALAAIEQTHFHAILADFDRGKGPALDLLAMRNISGGAVPIVV